MYLLFVLTITILNHFDITNGIIKVCKTFPHYNKESIENDMKCDKQFVFIENDEENNKQNEDIQVSAHENKLATSMLSIQRNFNQMNAMVQDEQISASLTDLSAIIKNQSIEIHSLQESYEQKKRLSGGIFSNCSDVSRGSYTRSGVYKITVPGRINPVQVYCDLNTDGESWLVFQRRMDGSVDFYRNWTEYEDGFGDLNGEFWLGLDLLNAITSPQSYQLRVDLEDWDGNTVYAVYKNFFVGNSQSNYHLSVNGYSGTAGDALGYHNNQQFSTKDRDNDAFGAYHCAQDNHGAWWYNRCHRSNLNGKYFRNEQINEIGINWEQWKNNRYAMKRTEMKIRPN